MRQVKTSTITARCDSYIKKILKQLSQLQGIPMTDVLVKSILEYGKNHLPSQLAKSEQSYFGQYSSNTNDLSVNYKQYLKRGLDDKYRNR